MRPRSSLLARPRRMVGRPRRTDGRRGRRRGGGRPEPTRNSHGQLSGPRCRTPLEVLALVTEPGPSDDGPQEQTCGPSWSPPHRSIGRRFSQRFCVYCKCPRPAGEAPESLSGPRASSLRLRQPGGLGARPHFCRLERPLVCSKRRLVGPKGHLLPKSLDLIRPRGLVGKPIGSCLSSAGEHLAAGFTTTHSRSSNPVGCPCEVPCRAD